MCMNMYLTKLNQVLSFLRQYKFLKLNIHNELKKKLKMKSAFLHTEILITEPIVNFKHPFSSCRTHFQNKFPEPV